GRGVKGLHRIGVAVRAAVEDVDKVAGRASAEVHDVGGRSAAPVHIQGIAAAIELVDGDNVAAAAAQDPGVAGQGAARCRHVDVNPVRIDAAVDFDLRGGDRAGKGDNRADARLRVRAGGIYAIGGLYRDLPCRP